MLNNQQLWEAVLAEIELNLSKANFTTWFHNTGIGIFENGNVIVCVPNTFTKAWLEKKYHAKILKTLEKVSGTPIQKIIYKVEQIKHIPKQPEQSEQPEKISEETTETPAATEQVAAVTAPTQRITEFGLNPRYTFDSFIVGKTNELAYAAAQAVATRPGVAYNPLFIYGGVGLGKTHLLQAIGAELLRTKRINNLLYVSCEKFTNDFLNSVRTGDAKSFKNRYRNVDLLIIDDVQFLAGKERTQEEFFHTFNELHQSNRQIILSSDRPPKAISSLEDRLKSRFEWGMIADVAAPDLETRIAILEYKCQARGFNLTKEHLTLIASVAHNNIRELEGVLNKVVAYHELKNIPPSMDTVKNLVSTLETTGARQPKTPKQVVIMVADFYGITEDEVLGTSREKRLAFPRQIAMFLMREELKLSYPAIGTSIGGRDHTTAMHAHTKISTKIQDNIQLKQEIETLKAKMNE